MNHVLHNKIKNKFNILSDLLSISKQYFGDVELLDECCRDLESTYMVYYVQAIPFFIEDPQNQQYQNVLCSINIPNRLDMLFKQLNTYITLTLESSTALTEKVVNSKFLGSEYSHINYVDAVRKLRVRYSQENINLTKSDQNYTICQCGQVMLICTITSSLRCAVCGYVTKMDGTAHEQTPTNKLVQDTWRKHAITWVNYTQAINDVSKEVTDRIDKKAVEHFTIGGELRDMSSLSCNKIREWLKLLRLTKYNNHAPSIRKIVTGFHGTAVVPPQLSSDEKDMVLNDIMKILSAFKLIENDKELLRRLGRKKIKKRTYYPYIIVKVYCHRLKYSPKLPGLIQCIHFQSATTLVQDDIIWHKLCLAINYPYEPTDIATLQRMK